MKSPETSPAQESFSEKAFSEQRLQALITREATLKERLERLKSDIDSHRSNSDDGPLQEGLLERLKEIQKDIEEEKRLKKA